MIFLQYLGVNVSSLTITALSIERYIAICHPMRAQSICTLKRAQKIIAGLWIFCIIYCCPWIVLTHTQIRFYSDGTFIYYCTFKLPRRDYLTYYMIDLFVLYLIPLFINLVIYVSIARALFASNALNRDNTSTAFEPCNLQSATGHICAPPPPSPRPPPPATQPRFLLRNFRRRGQATISSTRCSVATTKSCSLKTLPPNQQQQQQQQQRNKRAYMSVNSTQASVNSRIQVIKMLALVVGLFASLWLPYRSLVVYNSFAKRRWENLWFMLFCRTMVYSNSAVNPILYTVMSVKFRRAFKRLLLSCCCRCGSTTGRGRDKQDKIGTAQPPPHIADNR